MPFGLEERYKSDWNAKISDGDVKDEYAWATQTSYDPQEKIGRIKFTLFQFVEDKWQRLDTTLTEKCYEIQEIQSALENSGFAEVSIYDAERDFGVERGAVNTYFVCYKP